MRFTETKLAGVFIVDIEAVDDERGFFARSWCAREFAAHGLNSDLVQCNISYNRFAGTLRGMHYQRAPHEEVKLVRCIRGRAWDVVVDLRPESPSCRQWTSIELSADNHRMVYIPAGVAHGFQTLAPDTELFYQMGSFYEPAAAAGVRWDDPVLGVDWPLRDPIVSDRDRAFPLLDS
jgi:dTDP-4-dehydrorhamnose 3,5-epimerase